MGVSGALLAAGALQAVGSIQQGQAAAAASKANIRIAQRNRELEQQASYQQERRDRSTNITLIAKSGVRQAGSPLEVLAANAANAARQRVLDAESTQQQIEFMRGERRGALIGSGFTAAGQLLGAAGQAGAVKLRPA